MKRALLCIAVLASAPACESAQKHPAVTIGTVTGVMGFGLCELSVGQPGTCGIVGGSAALALGGITWLVTLLANTNAQEAPEPLEQQQGAREDVTEPPPGLPAFMLDGGVMAPPADAPVVDAAAAPGAM